jgi:hypothetical protein
MLNEILGSFLPLLGGIYYNYCLRSCKSIFYLFHAPQRRPRNYLYWSYDEMIVEMLIQLVAKEFCCDVQNAWCCIKILVNCRSITIPCLCEHVSILCLRISPEEYGKADTGIALR